MVRGKWSDINGREVVEGACTGLMRAVRRSTSVNTSIDRGFLATVYRVNVNKVEIQFVRSINLVKL